MSESEQSMKGTSQIKILNAEEIEGMRVVCKVNQHHNLPNYVLWIEETCEVGESGRHLLKVCHIHD